MHEERDDKFGQDLDFDLVCVTSVKCREHSNSMCMERYNVGLGSALELRLHLHLEDLLSDMCELLWVP